MREREERACDVLKRGDWLRLLYFSCVAVSFFRRETWLLICLNFGLADDCPFFFPTTMGATTDNGALVCVAFAKFGSDLDTSSSFLSIHLNEPFQVKTQSS